MSSALVLSTFVVVLGLFGSCLLDISFNPTNKKRSFQIRRLLNWSACGVLYAGYYMSRYAIALVNNPTTRARLGTTPQGMGGLLMLGFWSYGGFQVVNGVLVDHLGGKASFLVGGVSCGMIALGTASLFAFNTQSFSALLILNTVGMACNTFGSLGVVKINRAWYSQRERGVFSGIFGFMIAFGYWMALVGGSQMLASLSVQGLYFLASGVLFGASLLVLLVVRDDPNISVISSHAYPSKASSDTWEATETPRADASANEAPEPGQALAAIPESESTSDLQPSSSGPAPQISSFGAFKRVATNPLVQIAGVSLFCTGWVREGLLSWFTSYLQERYHVVPGSVLYIATATIMTMGGASGSMLGGYLSDRFFGSRRMPVAIIYFVGLIVLLSALATSPPIGATVALLGLSTSLILGVLSLLMGSVAVEVVSDSSQAGTASGLLNGLQYLGSGLGSISIGLGIDKYGWGAWAVCLIPAAAAALGACILLAKAIDVVSKARESTLV